MPDQRLFLFGVPRMEREERAVQIHRRKMLALTAYLAVTHQPQSRETLSALFWPDYDASSALANLRRDLSRLKDVLGKESLIVERDRIQIDASHLWVDVARFETLIRQYDEHLHENAAEAGAQGRGKPYCSSCEAALREAAGLYGEGFMRGFTLPDSPGFDEWQYFQAGRLETMQSAALQQLVQWSIDQQAYGLGIDYALRWLALDPLHEPACRQVMRLYARSGQVSAALRQYQVLAGALKKELGIEPEPETQALYEEIRTRRWNERSPLYSLADRPAMTTSTALRSGSAFQTEDKESPRQGGLLPQDRYELGNLVSSGGFGEVFLGLDRLTGQAVAIKRLRPDLVAQRPDLVERFLREGEVLSQLSHPNIVRMLADFERDGQRYLVMEYMTGGTLRELLDREKRLSLQQVLDISLELADALSRAHHLHILHRDLKPENILLDDHGRPRLSDFGLALLESHRSRLTQEGTIFGSPYYVSPEALHGMEMSVRSDVWSFGVILFEMLTAQPPFMGDQVAVVISKILNDPLPDVRQLRPNLPPRLENLIGQMLIKDVSLRAASMRWIAAELEAVRADYLSGSAGEPQPRVLDAPFTLTSAGAAEAQEQQAFLAAVPQPFLVTPPIPAPTTPFIGRDEELGVIVDLINQPECRLLTLYGTAGIGKTRLALEIASRLNSSFSAGSYFVSLASATEPDHILPAVAKVLQLPFSPGSDPLQQLLNHLQEEQLLLVMDNFEHLLEGVSILTEILDAAPGVQVLVTSRERLNLREECVYEVVGLSFPTLPEEGADQEGGQGLQVDEALQYGAVQLFIQRARRVEPNFTLTDQNVSHVARICRLVGGMPLALELAAPWMRMLSLEEIEREIERGLDILTTSLRNLPERHRSVRAMFEQTWRQLSEAERETLAQFSVFHGGCLREAAEQVTGAYIQLLMGLVDKALLRHRSGRFDMHELVRQFAAERLAADPGKQRQAFIRHYHYYLATLAKMTPWLKGGRQREATSIITSDVDNIRVAWCGAASDGEAALIGPAAEAYWLFNEFRGTLAEGTANFRKAVNSFLPVEDQPALAGFLLAGLGDMEARQWRLERGLSLMKEGIALLRRAQPPDRRREAFAQAWLAFMLVLQGRYSESAQLARESLRASTETGDLWTQAGSLRLLGATALYRGNLDEAAAYLEHCRSICHEIGEVRIRVYAHANLGLVHYWYGAYDRSKMYFNEAIRDSYDSGDRLRRADVLCEYGRLLLATGEFDQAIEVAKECIAIYRDLGRSSVSIAQSVLGSALRLQGEVEAAEQALAIGLQLARDLAHRPDMALAIEGLGCLSHERGDDASAVKCFNEALEIWRDLGHEPQMAVIYSRLGRALAHKGGGLAGAQSAYRQALEHALRRLAAPVALEVFTGLAELKIRENHTESAEILLQAALTHPAAAQETKLHAAQLAAAGSRRGRIASANAVPADWQRMAREFLDSGTISNSQSFALK